MDFTSNKIYSLPDIKNIYSFRYESLVYLMDLFTKLDKWSDLAKHQSFSSI